MERRAIFQRIAAEAERGAAVFPTNAEVALKVQRALDDPDCSVAMAAKLIMAEPLLATRVVAMANSVAYNRSGREISDIGQAVSRLGFRIVRSLATAVAVKQLSAAPIEPRFRDMAVQLWEHTAHVASLAHVIARRATRLDPEAAFFAGIVHEVSGFYLMSRAHEFPGLFDGEAGNWMSAWKGECEALVGRAVLKKLGVPEPAQNAVETYWQGYLALPPVSLGDTLLLAEDLAPVTSPLHSTERESRVAAEGSLDVKLGDTSLSEILKESAEEVASLTASLKF
ncbi:MAG: HDOD domain-containing protein [Gammaproteobacteria bacterium]|nr:HDOD domain-containing protein [Gammaproteobacteria bacterium]MBU1646505.1 HDOD domain-containing protein [Gammaproteobacteria bacterium]MBU1971867.1 HDOD domain-containing protein [Gammaproteobacteria bacterium]